MGLTGCLRPDSLCCLDPRISKRLERLVRADFAEADRALQLLGEIVSSDRGRERMLAAAVFGNARSRGHPCLLAVFVVPRWWNR